MKMSSNRSAARSVRLPSRNQQSGREPSPKEHEQDRGSFSRRAFLARVGGAAGASVAASSLPLAGGCDVFQPPFQDSECVTAPLSLDARGREAFQTRADAAWQQAFASQPSQECNGDEERYPNKIASYSKGLPHNGLGEVDLHAYNLLLAALASGNPADFESIPMGCPDPALQRKLVNPQSGLSFDMIGADSHRLTNPPAPEFASAEEAGEIVENYWMALLRDVPFADYGVDPLASAAVDDLNNLSDFRGPRSGGVVTPDTLFRGTTAGDLVGPYISQFLWRPAPFGAEFVERRMRTRTAGVDYMTAYADWLDVQNGCLPGPGAFEPVRRYIVTGRDLSEWVHIDVLFQAYFNAMLILLTPPDPDSNVGGIGAPFTPMNPYLSSQTQEGFGTFGPPGYAALVCEVASRALKAVWFQKWFVHRRLRPEAFAGRIHNHISGAASYPIHPDVLNSAAVDEVFNRNGTHLLPMAFPEGSPLHPAYGAGHATVAGACVTILKALFDESHEIPNPVVPDPNDPTQLVPYVGEPLTVGNELNKLANNVAIGRNIAGVHWRTDATASMKLGEDVAIAILRDHKLCFNEDFAGFRFTGFDGTLITI